MIEAAFTLDEAQTIRRAFKDATVTGIGAMRLCVSIDDKLRDGIVKDSSSKKEEKVAEGSEVPN